MGYTISFILGAAGILYSIIVDSESPYLQIIAIALLMIGVYGKMRNVTKAQEEQVEKQKDDDV